MRCAVVALLVAVPLAGCGGSGGSKSGPAKQFVSLGCASCHTLKAADAAGRIGPDLDKLRPPVATVERQVTNGGNGMPSYKGKLSAREIHALAVYVAGAAGGG